VTHVSGSTAAVPSEAFGEDRARGVEEAFDAAADGAGGLREWTVAIGGLPIRLRAAGDQVLERLGRAFAHLELDQAAIPSLTVNLWDSASTRTDDPPLPHVEGPQAPGSFHYYSDDRIRACFQPGTNVYMRTREQARTLMTRALSVYDASARTAWYWVDDIGRLPWWEEATPLRFILDWWLRDHGIFQLHSGAVGTSAGGVLLVGKSGSGKSTSTLACLGSELLYVGDDYVAVGLGEEPYVHSLYASGKLEPDHLLRLPHLEPFVSNPEHLELEKAVIYANESFPNSMSKGLPLRAIVAPRIVPGSTKAKATRVSPAVGLAALAPSTVFQLHTRGQEVLSATTEMARSVPSYMLEIGSDIGSIPVAVAEVVESLAAES
jgi:hypothetical protein